MNCPKCGAPMKEKTDKQLYSWWECKKCQWRMIFGSFSTGQATIRTQMSIRSDKKVRKRWNPSARKEK